MERRVELLSGLGAGVLGLMGVVTEAQTLSSPVTSPTVGWLLGTNSVPDAWDAIQNTHHALPFMAIVFLALMLGAYLHAVHRQTIGLALLVASTAVVIIVLAFALFKEPYPALLFVPSPLVVLTAVLAVTASACALSQTALMALFTRGAAPQPTESGATPAD